MNGLVAEIVEDHIRFHVLDPDAQPRTKKSTGWSRPRTGYWRARPLGEPKSATFTIGARGSRLPAAARPPAQVVATHAHDAK
jgi:hypothetical protein